MYNKRYILKVHILSEGNNLVSFNTKFPVVYVFLFVSTFYAFVLCFFPQVFDISMVDCTVSVVQFFHCEMSAN